jgi:hypothetical protein
MEQLDGHAGEITSRGAKLDVWQVRLLFGTDGRKGFAGTALFDENGRRCAYSRATWIQVKA